MIKVIGVCVCVYMSHSLNKLSTLVAEGIHQEHLARGGSSSGSAGNRRVEMNCRRRSTSCLKRLADSLAHTHIHTHRVNAGQLQQLGRVKPAQIHTLKYTNAQK